MDKLRRCFISALSIFRLNWIEYFIGGSVTGHFWLQSFVMRFPALLENDREEAQEAAIGWMIP